MYIPYAISQGVSLCLLLVALGLTAVSIGTNYWSQITYSIGQSDVGDGNVRFREKGPIFIIVKADGLWRECAAVYSTTMQNSGHSDDGAITEGARILIYEYCYNRYQKIVDQSNQMLDEVRVDLDSIAKRSDNIQAWQIACMALMGSSVLFGAIATFTTPLKLKRCGAMPAFLVLIAVISCPCAILLYSINYDRVQSKSADIIPLQVEKTHFGWSMWCAVAACVCFILACAGFTMAAKLRSLRDYSRVI